jgi:hypothetical protein
VLRRLLPAAHDCLRELGASDRAREHYLGIIEQRCLTRRTGATWQRDMVAAHERAGCDRENALHAMLRTYLDNGNTGRPVHTWPLE